MPEAKSATGAVIAACSFCQKPNTEVGRLVAGPGVFICGGCVELCSMLIPGEPMPEPVAPWDLEENLDQVLDLLPRILTAAEQVEQNLTQWVRRARALGATWTRIGGALGVTRQAAWERFSAEE